MTFELEVLLVVMLAKTGRIGMQENMPNRQQALRMECGKIYNTTAHFPAKTLPVVNVIIPNSHNSSFKIASPCCENVKPNDVHCSSCSENGERVCFVNQSEVIDLHMNTTEDCLRNTSYYFTCHASLCNSSFPPGYETACRASHVKEICQNDGSWKTIPCQNGSMEYQSTNAVTPTKKDDFQWAYGINLSSTTGVAHNGSSSLLDFPDVTPSGITTEKVSNESSTSNLLDEEQVKRDMINFLIAFGVVLGVVFIIVCGFFIRKAKMKKDNDNFSLEYWQEPEYIESICGKGSCSINPLHNDMTHFRPEQRFTKKNASTFYNSRSSSSLGKQGKSIDNIDVPRRMGKGNTNKYVTSATGSNFYSYRASPDVDLGDTGSEQSPPKTPNARRDIDKTSSFRPRSDKRPQKPRRQKNESDEMTSKTRRNDDEYDVTYKDKLKSELDNWSAEESDV